MDLGPVLSEPPAITSRLDVEGKKFWPRAFAYIIDFVVLNLTSFAVGVISIFAFRFILYLIVVAFGYSYRTVFPETNNFFMNFALGFLISLTYFIPFEALTGITPGKLILKMRVATLDGNRPSLKAVTIRAL
jgi:uncharacterized RDD family membrane protein YckC